MREREPCFAALTQATREADQLFESGQTGGGGTRHWLRECFLPAFEEKGLTIADAGQLRDARRLASTIYDEAVRDKAWWVMSQAKELAAALDRATTSQEDRDA